LVQILQRQFASAEAKCGCYSLGGSSVTGHCTRPGFSDDKTFGGFKEGYVLLRDTTAEVTRAFGLSHAIPLALRRGLLAMGMLRKIHHY
jgi:hypothetical protein